MPLVRLQKAQTRTAIEGRLQLLLNEVKKIDQDAACEYSGAIDVSLFEFFKAQPELFDPDLSDWINIDYLIKDAYRLAQQIKVLRRQLAAETWLTKQASNQPEAAKPRHRKSPNRSQVLPSPGDRHKSPRSSSGRRDAAR